jgi:putative transcriptional regulator
MPETPNLRDHFLIAMPGLSDPNFFHTVTYMCDHNDEGAMGLVVNRPMELNLGELLDHLGLNPIDEHVAQTTVYQGGPVQTERGFILHEGLGNWEATLPVTTEIAVTMSQDIIEAIARGQGPSRYLIMLGYAGWGAGQLEQELGANSWLNGPADPRIIFDTGIEQRWSAAASLLGVEIDRLSSDVGHA